MASYVPVGKTSDLEDGGKKKLEVLGVEIMLARVGDKYYATQNRCPHMGGDLSAGKLEGTVITCPRHGSQFDLIDGHNIRWTRGTGIMSTLYKFAKSPRPIKTYTVKIEGDNILIDV
jgi:3-phenylpropionate/trans-cinnamate dioxygenase ferredoxin subunit